MRQGKNGGLQQGPIPSDPTGRMVITKADQIKNGGAQVVHWCPGPKYQGETWICPDCQAEFVRESDQWREQRQKAA